MASRTDTDDREAPSSVIHACAVQARWHLVMALVMCALSGIIFWVVFEMTEAARMISEAPRGQRPDLPQGWALMWGGGCSLLSLCNGLLLFRSHSAIRRLVESRRVSDLHLALRRLRAVWRMFGLSPLLAVLPALVLQVWGWISPLN